jgi:hypothetical protein
MNLNKQKTAKSLFNKAVGYGLSEEDIFKCLENIPDNLLDGFLYTMSRIAEKSGHYAFQEDNNDNYNEVQ